MELTRILKYNKKSYIKGKDVLEVQIILQNDGFDPKGLDGIYGRNTTNAVKRFQKANNLVVDGIVGKNTWKKLNEKEKEFKVPTSPSLSSKPNAIVTANRISVRNGRGSSYEKLGTLKHGDKIIVLDKSFDYKYIKIIFNDKVGYAYSNFGKYIDGINYIPENPIKEDDPETPEPLDEISKKIKDFIDIVKSCVGGKYIFSAQGNKITESYVRGRIAKYKSYFSGSRDKFLLNIGKLCDKIKKWVFPNDYAWDCSGLFWYAADKLNLFGSRSDSTADYLYKNLCEPIKKSELCAGDCVFYGSKSKKTHMGVVGYDGKVYEAMSGYVGVRVGDVDDRTEKRIVGSGTYKGKAWNYFGRPKCFIK